MKFERRLRYRILERLENSAGKSVIWLCANASLNTNHCVSSDYSSRYIPPPITFVPQQLILPAVAHHLETQKGRDREHVRDRANFQTIY